MQSLREAILSDACVKRKPKNWLDRLPAEVRQLIEETKAEWRAGTHPASALGLARSIVEHCRARGIETCSVTGVRLWLAAD